MAIQNRISLLLFFTYGVDLKTWDQSGLISREIELYLRLAKEYSIRIGFVTYGDLGEFIYSKILPNIEIVPLFKKFKKKPNRKNKISYFLASLLGCYSNRAVIANYDVYKSNQLWGSWLPIFCSKIFRKPVLLRAGYEFSSFSIKQKRSSLFVIASNLISRFCYANASLINITSLRDGALIKKKFHVDESKILIRQNWIDTNIFRPSARKVTFTDPRLLFVGRLVEQKNLYLLLDSMFKNSFTLSIYGDGPLKRELESYVVENDLKVDFYGNVSNDKLPEVYNNHDFFVLPSEYEGNPKVLLEAMACGSVVIVNNAPGLNNIVSDSLNGVIVNDSSELADRIVNLTKNPSLCRRLSMNARKYVISNNSLISYVDREYEQIIRLHCR